MPSQRRIIELFGEAQTVPSGPARERFLDEVCRDDGELRRQLIELLEANERAGDFLVPSQAALGRMDSETPGQTIGRYTLREKVGEGGCGVVYVADQQQPVRRRVALKVIKLGMDTKQVIARFEAERQALAMMDHPNIAKVLDAGSTESGRPYFVMELVRGVRITDYCDAHQLDTRDRLDLFIQVCHAIQHAHQKGIIHRDIKPSNILVPVNDGKAVPKVIDFGIAKATEGRLTDESVYTQLHQVVGTPAYMSPEQADMTSLDIDTRSDVYSLGVLLYELLAGNPPFESSELLSAGLDAMRKIIREKEPLRPSTRLASLRPAEQTTTAKRRASNPPRLIHLLKGDLDWIVMKCLEKDRTRRYETASGLAADLTRHLTNEPVLARPPSLGYRLYKTWRRHKFLVSAVLVLALATAISIWQARRATQAQKFGQQRLAEAESVSAFLTGVFQSSDPARDGRTITVAEILDKAVTNLQANLEAEPSQRAHFQETLAQSYKALGLGPKAIPVQEAALDYYRKAFGPDQPKTIRALHALAGLYRDVGRLTEAIQLAKGVLEQYRSAYGSEHADTLSAILQLAACYMDAGRREEALKLHQEARPISLKLYGPGDIRTLRASLGLGNSYFRTGRASEALQLREEVLASAQESLGPEHPLTLTALSHLAASAADGGRWDEAAKLGEKAFSLQKKALGERHEDTLITMANLATAYSQLGRRAQSVQMLESVLAIRQELYGENFFRNLPTMQGLGNSYSDAGRTPEALKLREKALALQLKVNGTNHPDTSMMMGSLAISLYASSRFSEALALREEALANSRKVNGLQHPATLWLMTALADSYFVARRLEEMADLLGTALPLHQNVLGPNHPRTLQLTYNLAVSLLVLGQTSEATPHLEMAAKANPPNVEAATLLGALLAWNQNSTEYLATVSHMLDTISTNSEPTQIELVARLACLLPPTESSVLSKVAMLAQSALRLRKDEPLIAYAELTAAIADYRNGQFISAEATLARLEGSRTLTGELMAASRAYRALCLIQSNRPAEAQIFLNQAISTLEPLVKDPFNPLKGVILQSYADFLLGLLACREAKPLLHKSSH